MRGDADGLVSASDSDKEKLQERVAKLSGGVVPGGDRPDLIRVLKSLKDLEGKYEDQTVGIRLPARAIEVPPRQIVENAGEDAAVVLNAASVAGLLLTTEVMIADAPKDEAGHGHGPQVGW